MKSKIKVSSPLASTPTAALLCLTVATVAGAFHVIGTQQQPLLRQSPSLPTTVVEGPQSSVPSAQPPAREAAQPLIQVGLKMAQILKVYQKPMRFCGVWFENDVLCLLTSGCHL